MSNWEERRQIVKVANLYYSHGWTQAQIAKKLGVSRPVISKILNKAKEQGIVEIYINEKNQYSMELEERIKELYDLEEVIVVPTTDLPSELIQRAVGKAAASYVSKTIDHVQKIGITWGNTLLNFIKEYPYERRSNLQIIPLVGGMGNKLVELHSNLLAFQFSKKLHCSCSYLYAPAMVETEELKERFIQSEDLSTMLEEGRNVDMAIIGIGNPFKGSTMVTMEYLTEKDLIQLKKEGAIGDIGSRFYDLNGKELEIPLNNKVIGISLEELKKVPKVIGIVEGNYKVESTIAALKGKNIDVLIIDELTATSLLNKSL